MDIRQLRYFISVAEEGNFSRAAERLHISQPPLSQQIKSLEDSLRVTLFVRGRHGARLTRAGEALLVRARSIVSDCDSVEKLLRRVADGLEGYIRIGIINSVMYGPLPRTLRLFQKHNPEVEWTLHELLPDLQQEALVRGQIDVGFACSPTGHRELRSILVYPQPLVVALPDSHPLAGCRCTSLGALSGDPFVLLNTQSPMIRGILAACIREGFQPRVLHESADPETILSLVGAGVGISILPESLSTTPRENVAFVAMDEPAMNADLYATIRRDDSLPALERFLALLTEVTEAWRRESSG
ncbi:LysR substrate-binding domain-containing protein [Caballeronia ptereochthonis]|uniref:LysR family transcriptional regulator n=1 Tax=Caballeronia ptereochthonis TaxID=1777144 RepID=A0A157ZWI8_9BURK|nr:LysR substrate-binding domain-containing protein [Caballeronia ptereochthonis]SAK49898.1 LysR family transcriptional regulator [Caballeronia ptereochthonis]